MARFKRSKVPSRVYVYGLMPPVEGQEAVFDQLRKAQLYYNDMIAITRSELDARRAAQLESPWGSELLEAEAKVSKLRSEDEEIDDRIKAERKRERSRVPADAELRRRKKELKPLIDKAKGELSDLRSEINSRPEVKEKFKSFVPKRWDLIKTYPDNLDLGPGLRRTSGAFNGTYMVTEQAAEAARDHAFKFWSAPNFRKWNGSGTIAVQVKSGGASVDELFRPNKKLVQIIDERRFRTTKRNPQGREIPNSCWWKMRVTPGAKGVDAVWPMIMHRPLPPGAKVKWAKVIRKKIGLKWKWELHLTVEAPSFLGKTADPDGDSISVHFHPFGSGGQKHRGVCVAVAYDTEANEHFMTLKPRKRRKKPEGHRSHERFEIMDVLDAMQHAGDSDEEGLRGTRDANFNEIRRELRAWLDYRECPEWLVERTKHMDKWRSPKKMALLALDWRKNRFEGDASMFTRLDEWRKQDKHLYQWEADERVKARRYRKDLYRKWARKLADTYTGWLVIEEIDFSKMARRPKVDEDNELGEHRRRRRGHLAASELRIALKSAFAGRIIELKSANRGAKCVVCGSKIEDQLCKKCGDLIPAAGFARCWRMMIEAGFHTTAFEEKWAAERKFVEAIRKRSS